MQRHPVGSEIGDLAAATSTDGLVVGGKAAATCTDGTIIKEEFPMPEFSFGSSGSKRKRFNLCSDSEPSLSQALKVDISDEGSRYLQGRTRTR